MRFNGLRLFSVEGKTEDTANPDLVTGNWVIRCEMRTSDDIASWLPRHVDIATRRSYRRGEFE
jgi:hypothetical protein